MYRKEVSYWLQEICQIRKAEFDRLTDELGVHGSVSHGSRCRVAFTLIWIRFKGPAGQAFSIHEESIRSKKHLILLGMTCILRTI